MKMCKQLLALLSLCLFANQSIAQSAIQQAVLQAMQSDIRSEDDRIRDANRQPVEILEFFGLEQDMTVVELIPAGGWYTKILAPVLSENGKLYITQPDNFYSGATNTMLAIPELSSVERLPWGEGDNGGSGLPASGDWGARNVDMVLTFRNYHNFSVAGRMEVNRSAFQALRPGGLFGVIDHTRRHMEADSRANGRRVDPVTAIKEIQDAGFILIDYTTLLARDTDQLDLEVGSSAVSGQTDRFTFLFMKPE